MAPEQAGGKTREVGTAADVYALGGILYECLSGQPPFKGPTPTDILIRVLTDDPIPPRQLNPSVPRDLETITLQCLRKEPQKRYASAADLADDLRRFLQGEPIRARPLSLRERVWRRRRRLLAAGLILLVLTLLGIGTYALLGWQRERRDRAFEEALARGVKQTESKNPKEAVDSFTEALRLRPDSSLALAHRGIASFYLGDHDRALGDLAEAVRLDPENALAYRGLGGVFVTLRRYEEAVANLTKAINLDPDQVPPLRNRANAYLHLGKWSLAEDDLKAALGRAPTEPDLYRLRSILDAAQGRWDEAGRDDAWAGSSPDSVLFTRVAAALASGDEKAYCRFRDELVTVADNTGDGTADLGRPFSSSLQAARACALVEAKTAHDQQRLVRLLGQARSRQVRDNVFTLRVQALVWLRTDKVKDAMRLAEAGLKSDPYYSPGINYLLLSIAHNLRSEARDADLALESAIKAGMPVIHIHDTLEYQVLLREARTGRSKP
jgi:Tfp pilus assembly protein PilF